jgi:hypothetical protein
MSRAQLRLARIAYGGLALADRARGVRCDAAKKVMAALPP